MARLSKIVLVLRDVSAAVRFYRDGLGMCVGVQTPTYAKLQSLDSHGQVQEGPSLELNQAES